MVDRYDTVSFLWYNAIILENRNCPKTNLAQPKLSQKWTKNKC